MKNIFQSNDATTAAIDRRKKCNPMCIRKGK